MSTQPHKIIPSDKITQTDKGTRAEPRGGAGVWSRRWVRVSTMVVGFVAVMLAANSIASTLGDRVAALLIGPLVAVLVLWLYRVASRHIERRPVPEASARGAARGVLVGFAGGLLLSAIVIGVLALFGAYEITGWGSVAGALAVVGMMCAVAVAEEVLFRGVILRLIQQRWGTWISLGTSALLFGLAHLINPGATLWGAIAITVEAGLMLGAAYVATGSLWLPIGLHLGWNIATVAVFGTITSGSEARDALVTATASGPAWLSGGAFGPEGSVVAVLVCSMATAILLVIAYRRGRIVPRRR